MTGRSAMKVRQQELARLLTAVSIIDTPETRRAYQELQAEGKLKAQDLWKRYRWGLYHCAYDAGFRFDEDTYYDAHIDTALRAVVPELLELAK